MLVLTRKAKQSIMIGSHIEVTILKIENDQVRIGITAPADVSVHRREIYETIQKTRENPPTASEDREKGQDEPREVPPERER